MCRRVYLVSAVVPQCESLQWWRSLYQCAAVSIVSQSRPHVSVMPQSLRLFTSHTRPFE